MGRSLAGQFGERQVLVAILTDEIAAEGRSCIVQAGKDWMAVPGPDAEVAG